MSAARGDFVAYCGHDDIWHPEHLSTLMATIGRTGGDAAAAGVVTYGPADSGIMSIAGMLRSDALEARHIVPPSGFLHRRDLIWDIGWWTKADTIAMPPDCDFQMRVAKNGPIYTSGELTVFKFDAASRRDAYVKKDVSEQEQALAGLANDPEFRYKALLRVAQSFSCGQLQSILVPDVSKLRNGEWMERVRRHKGVDPRFSPTDMKSVEYPFRFFLEKLPESCEWHSVEESATLGTYRWSGPVTQSFIDIPIIIDRRVLITLRIAAIVDPAILASIDIAVNGQNLDYAIERRDGHDVYLVLEADGCSDYLQIAMQLSRTMAAGAQDHRLVGIAVAWVEITES